MTNEMSNFHEIYSGSGLSVPVTISNNPDIHESHVVKICDFGYWFVYEIHSWKRVGHVGYTETPGGNLANTNDQWFTWEEVKSGRHVVIRIGRIIYASLWLIAEGMAPIFGVNYEKYKERFFNPSAAEAFIIDIEELLLVPILPAFALPSTPIQGFEGLGEDGGTPDWKYVMVNMSIVTIIGSILAVCGIKLGPEAVRLAIQIASTGLGVYSNFQQKEWREYMKTKVDYIAVEIDKVNRQLNAINGQLDPSTSKDIQDIKTLLGLKVALL